MDGRQRKDIRPGLRVAVVMKPDQRTGKHTIGIVKDILTSAATHPHGIKVRLQTGQVGRVKAILPDEPPQNEATTPPASG
ncbi:MAG: YwbE family protein [Chloroflexaceae bacterium]